MAENINAEEKRCAICGSTKNLELDHIIPLSKGGTDEPDNLQWLCRTSNRRKRDKVSYYNSDKEAVEQMIIDSLEIEYEPLLDFYEQSLLDPIRIYEKISKVFFILPKDFYKIYKKWKIRKLAEQKQEIINEKKTTNPIQETLKIIDLFKDEKDMITKECLLDLLKKKKIPDPEEVLKKLSHEGYIFYPSPDVIQRVEI